jgi:hypothetical protein
MLELFDRIIAAAEWEEPAATDGGLRAQLLA